MMESVSSMFMGRTKAALLTFLLGMLIGMPLFADEVTLDVSVEHIDCYGDADGRITVQISSGTADYDYLLYRNGWPWGPGIRVDSIFDTDQTSITFLNLEAARYYIIVEDGHGDPGFAVISVTQPDPLQVASITIAKGLSCFDACDGQLVAHVSGGTAPYTYSWSKTPGGQLPDADSVAVNLCQGEYSCVVTDANNCGSILPISASFSFIKTNPAASDSIPDPLAGGAIGSSQVICNNGDVAEFTSSAGAGGGSGIHTYTWQYSTTSSTAGSGVWTDIPASDSPTWDYGILTQTTYFVRKVTDPVCGTAYSNVITVTVRPPLNGGNIASGQTICYNSDVAAFTSSTGASGGSGNYTFTWQFSTTSDIAGSGMWTDIPASNSPVWDYGNLTQTTYFVRKVTDPVCGIAYSNVLSVTVRPPLIGGTIASDQDLCYGSDVKAFTSVEPAGGGSGSLTYTWQYSTTSSSPGSGAWTNIPDSDSQTLDYGNLTQTTNFVRSATDLICGNIYSNVITVTVRPALIGGTITGDQNLCYNSDAAPFASASPASGGSGDITYTWQYSVTSNTAGSGVWTDIPASDTLSWDYGILQQTTYFVRRATDSLCGNAFSNVLTVTVNSQLSGGTIASGQTICSSSDVAAFTSTADASGGSGIYTYTWQYSVTSNTAGSGVWTDIPASDYPAWDYGNLTQTTWFVRRVMDPLCGIAYSNVITVTVEPAPAAVAGNDAIVCHTAKDWQVTSAAADNYAAIRWTVVNGSGSFNDDSVIDPVYTFGPSDYNMGSGKGIVLVLAAQGIGACGSFTDRDTMLLVLAPKLAASVGSLQTSCHDACDARAIVTISGGTAPYQIEWSDGLGQEDTLQLCAGAYFAVVTDALGCIDTAHVNVIAPLPVAILELTHTDTISCYGSNSGEIRVKAGGGTGTLSYTLLPGGIPSDAPDEGIFTNLTAGTYTLRITDDNGCTVDTTLTIDQKALLQVQIDITHVIGEEPGSIVLTTQGGTPPYRYSVDGGKTMSDDPAFQGLTAGVYEVYVTDALGCTFRDQVTILVNDLDVYITHEDVSCHGLADGSFLISAQNGTAPYTLIGGFLSAPLVSSDGLFSFTGQPAGVYDVVVEDAAGMVYKDTIEIKEPDAITALATITEASCSANTNDGAIRLDVAGGTGTYTFLWSNGAATEDLAAVEAGFYNLTLSDGNGCEVLFGFEVPALHLVTAYAGEDDTICAGTTYQLSGSAADSLVWEPSIYLDDPHAYNPHITIAEPTAFTLSVYEGMCWDRDTVVISLYAERGLEIYDPSGYYDIDSTLSLVEGNSYLLEATPGFESYLWAPVSWLNNPSAQQVLVSAPMDIYVSVTATTEEGCVESDTVHIILDDQLFIYTGFSPNGDGINDSWVIRHAFEFGDKIYVRVFNRWGEPVFESRGYGGTNEWDGTRNGRPMPVGAYYYIVDVNGSTTKTYTGTVTLIR